MKMFTSTKVLLILALLAANIVPARTASASCGSDPNCNKTCGAISEVTGETRTCSGGTCWVTICTTESSLCDEQYGSDKFNDGCNSMASFFCEPY
jgi:hypothetical protein